MKIVLFGGGGFIGKRLALQLLKQGSLNTPTGAQPISKLIIFDKFIPSFVEDERLSLIEGDITSKEEIYQIIDEDVDVIYHIAAVVSGEAETDFDLGMNVNLHATRYMLERCRELKTSPMFIFASTCGVFGGDLPEVVNDLTNATPQSSYGTAKAIDELLINDYSRRGWIDGRSLRLPTIVIRPGKPNAATSSFASSVLREPLMGNPTICPVDRSTKLWISSPKKAVDNFIHAARIPAKDYGKSRIVSLPGITSSIDEMVKGLESAAGKEAVSLIEWKPDSFIQGIFYTVPSTFNTAKANQLGFVQDQGIGDLIELFQKEELGK